MMRIAVVTILCLGACEPLARGSGDDDPQALRVCVENSTVGYGVVIARAGLVRFNVQPGHEECRKVMATGVDMVLRAVTTGGGIAGPVSYAQPLEPNATGCWRWVLTNASASAANLRPCWGESGAGAGP